MSLSWLIVLNSMTDPAQLLDGVPLHFHDIMTLIGEPAIQPIWWCIRTRLGEELSQETILMDRIPGKFSRNVPRQWWSWCAGLAIFGKFGSENDMFPTKHVLCCCQPTVVLSSVTMSPPWLAAGAYCPK